MGRNDGHLYEECVMGGVFSLEVLGAFLAVLLIDLILSGDNAVVIALAVRNLQGNVRRRAIQLGVAAAIGLRIIFAFSSPSSFRYRYCRSQGGCCSST